MTEIKCVYLQRQRHIHHQHQRQDSTSSTNQNQFPYNESTDATVVNGDRSANHHRRGSQTSQASISYLRKDSVGSPQRSLDSPKPARSWATQQRALEQHRSPQLSSSCGTATVAVMTQSGHPRHGNFQRQESFPGYSRDDATGYGRNTSSQYADVSQITAVQVTPRPKIRSFPRTNPAYVGVHRRDGQPSYKKVNIENIAPATTPIYNQCFNDAHPPPMYDPGSPPPGSCHATNAFDFDTRGQYRAAAIERSDSDTSHSSFGLARLQQDITNTCSQASQAFSLRHTPTHQRATDSQSSQGSLHVQQDSHSSAGSLRVQDISQDSGSSQQNSPRHTIAPPPQISPRNHNAESPRPLILQRRNSEPDYANLQIIAHMKDGKILSVVENPVAKPGTKLCTTGIQPNDDTRIENLKNGDSLRSGDSLSPAEYSNRQDTPSSVRSRSTQNSSRSHTSEGWSGACIRCMFVVFFSRFLNTLFSCVVDMPISFRQC